MKTTDIDSASSEQHFTPAEIALRWKVSVDFVRRAFTGQSGVLIFNDKIRRAGRRRYSTIRVPGSVLQRLERLISTAGRNEDADRR